MNSLSPRGRRELTRFMKFSVVGVIGAVVDFGTFNILNSFLGLRSLFASILSFITAVTSNFIWNRFWTYPDSRSKPVRQQALQFALVNTIGLFIRTPVFALSETPMIRLAERLLQLLPPSIYTQNTSQIQLDHVVIGRNLALAVAVIVVLFWNFGVNRIWTYSDAP
ncbi:MAG: GtrA family protein [Anaerolineaceae bacterium]|nr:MAG: GtrA family protein [Anaerolineaceae bacterium]